MSAYAPTASGELVTDQVTGLAVRSTLLADLGAAVKADGVPSLLALFALDGFKEFEELYGVIEGRKLLRRFAERLRSTVEGLGGCYRPRGDEFAVLVEGAPSVPDLLGTCAAALSEADRYYHVEAAGGHALLPDEATDPIEALIVADRRLLANAPRRGPRR